MLEAIDGAEHTIDFLTFVYWSGEIGREFADAARRRGREAGVRVRVLLDAWGAHPMDATLIDADGGRRRPGALVPPAAPAPARPGQPPHPPQGADRRRGGRRSPAASASPTSGRATRATRREWRDTHFRIHGPAVDGLRAAFLDNWAETDPELFDEGVDRFPDQPKPGDVVVQCVRGASETGWSDVATLFRTLLQLAERARADHHRVLRARRRAHRPPLRRGRTAASRSRSCCPVPTPTSGSSSSPARRRTRGCSSTASSSGTSSRRCCTPRS